MRLCALFSGASDVLIEGGVDCIGLFILLVIRWWCMLYKSM